MSHALNVTKSLKSFCISKEEILKDYRKCKKSLLIIDWVNFSSLPIRIRLSKSLSVIHEFVKRKVSGTFSDKFPCFYVSMGSFLNAKISVKRMTIQCLGKRFGKAKVFL